MLGYDAFERRQTARDALGGVVSIGEQARDALLPYLDGGSFQPSGGQSYGRPVGVLESSGGADVGALLLRQGVGLAAPDYLRDDPARLGSYMEAERLARLNRLGVHGDSYVSPEAYRRGATETPPAARPKGDGPWAAPEWSDTAGAAAVFADDPTPFQGLRRDIEAGYLAVTENPNSTVDDIVGYGAANGFKVDRKDAERFVANRAKGIKSSGQVEYKRAPRVLTDPGDGTFGATMRGVGDPLNVLDELGAVVDSLGGTEGRENLSNSDRRWADIWANNLDQNRSILANDDAEHPYARFGGQLASGLAIPTVSLEGVGLNAARSVLRAGGTRMAAVEAAEAAVRRRLAAAGGAEGAVIGAGGAEGGWAERAKGAAIGAPIGAALGFGTAGLAQRVGGLVRGARAGRAAVAGEGSDTASVVSREADPVEAVSPAAAADTNVASPVTGTTIDTAALRAAADNGAGVDMARAGEVLRQSADDALSRGDDVVLHVGGKAIPITSPGLVDDAGQRWGAMSILSPARGDNARLEIVPKAGRDGDTAGPWQDFTPAPAASTRTADPLADPTAFPVQPREMPAETFRGPLSDHTPIIWREMGFDTDGFGRATIPSQYAPRWRNEGGTDALMFADNPAMATGQGANKGILFEYDAAPFVGRPQFDKPGGALAWRNGAGEYSTNGVTQDTLQSALRGFRVKPGALDAMPERDRSLFDMMARDLEAKGWQRTDLDDGSMIYRRPDANPSPASTSPSSPTGRPGALTGAQYVETYAAPSTVKDYVAQPPGGLGSAVIGPDGKLHMFRTNGSQMGHADEVGHYDFGYATGPDEAAGFAELTRYRGEIAVTRSANETPQQARALNELVARARREGLNIIDEQPKPAPSAAARAEWDDILRAYDERHGASGPWNDFAPVADDVAGMANETPRPTLDGPRVPDRIELRQPRQLLADAPDGERIAAAARLNSGDVLPLPANTVRDIDEAAGIEAGRYQTVRAPNEAAALERRNVPSPTDATRTIPKRGPLDLVTWLRTQGGVREDGGELTYAGITNAPRNGMDFASGEQRFGKLVADDGLPLDTAAQRAWEAGYFPDHAEPPTPAEFLDALTNTHRGWNRSFHPDDLAEVDAFDAARAQRLDVEAAQADGAPLTLDRGQPVGPDDLDAMTPPVRAYEEWGENAPNLAGNIRLDRLDSPQAIKQALVRTEQATGGFDAAKRGRITQAETKALAEDLGMTADDLLQRRKGQAFNAEEALAARQLLARSAADLVNMAKRIARTRNPGDEAEAAFREAWLRHAAIQEQVAGMTAEAGRLLQQFRMTADSRDAEQALSSIGDILGGSTRIKDVAERIIDLEQVGTSPAGINQFALKSLLPKWKDMATELYINSLLSGPQTHAVNILSNTLTSLAQLPEHLVAAGVGAVRKALPGQDETDRVLFSEFGARAAGMIAGAREGVKAAARSLLTGESSDAITKIETQQMQAIPGPIGSVIRTPSRFLTAEDELFKGIARRMELNGLAIRQAAKEGLTGAEARERAADLVLNPTDDMLRKSFEYARYLTFQTPLDHGSMAAGLSAGLQHRPEFKLLIPFVRTPVNLLKFAAERSPIAPVMKSWRKEFAAGGARRDMAITRMALGTGLGAMMYEMAAAGHITGSGPADADARRLMQANGWQPYSLKVGDNYYSYQRFDPFSTTIGTVADMVDLQADLTDKEKEKSSMLMVAAIVNNLSNKTWLSGLSSGLEAVNDPDRYLEPFLARMAGAVAVPSVVAQVAKMNDPILREARSPIDRIRSRIPGMSSRLYPRRNVFGEPMRIQNALGPDIVSPLWTSTGRNDPTIDALLSAGVSISPPQRSYTSEGKRVEWTPGQYDALQEVAGRLAKPALDDLTQTGDWLMMDQDEQKDSVRDVLRDARKEAKESILGEFQFVAPGTAIGPWKQFADTEVPNTLNGRAQR
ncbi:hypothetical protein ASE78_05910 [Sphingomonas sp. Leaf25]|nr:hypothetical protein ASE78_05910 [Sphingomonas sp. Leaf25]